MKEILKSKGMFIFVLFMVGTLFINAMDIQKMENSEIDSKSVYNVNI